MSTNDEEKILAVYNKAKIALAARDLHTFGSCLRKSNLQTILANSVAMAQWRLKGDPKVAAIFARHGYEPPSMENPAVYTKLAKDAHKKVKDVQGLFGELESHIRDTLQAGSVSLRLFQDESFGGVVVGDKKAKGVRTYPHGVTEDLGFVVENGEWKISLFGPIKGL